VTAERPLPWELDLGVVPSGDGRARARVWAPAASTLAMRIGTGDGTGDHPMTPVALGGEPIGEPTDQARRLRRRADRRADRSSTAAGCGAAARFRSEDGDLSARDLNAAQPHGSGATPATDRLQFSGVWEAEVPAVHGDDYWLVLDDRPLPDPASRWQPEGVRGPSRVVDPAAFTWTDDGWAGVALEDLVLYELHVGTFTPEGTFDAVTRHFAELADLGVTAIGVMPIAEFPGQRGWGYDGVHLWSAQSSYGGPEAFARMVDAAHAAGLGVVLDVVYNHLGPTGSEALAAFGPYFTEKYSTPWGSALNYDDADSGAVREWVVQSAEWFVRDLHVDGLRLDAIHAIFDQSAKHLVAEVAERVHALGARAVGSPSSRGSRAATPQQATVSDRSPRLSARPRRPGTLVIAESGLNDPVVIRPPERGGWGADAQWADDFHHALRVLVTGDDDGYYAEFGAVADLAKAFHRPFVHDGQYSTVRRRRFGAPAGDRPVNQFVVFAQNHDQIGNRALGDRLPVEARPLAAFCALLAPFTPMLFMGEEYGEEAPFQFFTDHIDPFVAEAAREGRRREFASFAAFTGADVPDPQASETFERSKLTRRPDPRLEALYRDLLRIRRDLPSEEAHPVYDEDARWLRVHRGPYQLVCNFSNARARVPTDPVSGDIRQGNPGHMSPETGLVVATHDDVLVGDGFVELPALAGVLLR
jgi:maltooligosyltrehalose trehalohydrolase